MVQNSKYIQFNTSLHSMMERTWTLDSGDPRFDFGSAHLSAVSLFKTVYLRLSYFIYEIEGTQVALNTWHRQIVKQMVAINYKDFLSFLPITFT